MMSGNHMMSCHILGSKLQSVGWWQKNTTEEWVGGTLEMSVVIAPETFPKSQSLF